MSSEVFSLTRRELLGSTAFGAMPVPKFSDRRESRVIVISPGEGDSFNYPYLLYTPPTTTDEKRPLLVQPNNSGTTTDDFATHRKRAREDVERGFPRLISEELRVPLLVPIFPRPESEPVDWRHYVHQLDTETMHISGGPLERVDRQLVGMIEDAQDRLSTEIALTDRVMLNGYSASGNFVNRFTILHPELVTSVTAGGVNGMVTLPLREANGRTLNYQIGVADVEEITGDPFDVEAFCEVDQYVYMGAEDQNDTLPGGDAWSDRQREIAREVYGEDMQEDRFPYCESVYSDVGASAEFELYEGVGHTVTEKIERDVVTFHREHAELPDTGAEGGSSRRDVSILDILDALGIPIEAFLTGSVTVLAGLAFLMRRLDK